MNLHFNELTIVIPSWLIVLLMILLLIQTTMSLVSSYYKMKIAKMKVKSRL